MRISIGHILRNVVIACGVCLFVFLGSILPRMQTGLYASPDETAVSIFSQSWTREDGFRLQVVLKGAGYDIVQLHPRSMIRQGDWLVPVGFLGMPFLVMLMNSLRADIGEYFTLMLTLSSAIPLFWLIRKSLGRFIAWSSVLIYLFFPTVLLYVNRGYFPNLPVVAYSIWGLWMMRLALSLIDSKKYEQFVASGFAGLFFGLALFIRPIEVIWLLPWMIWSVWPLFRSSIQWSMRLKILIPMIVVLIAIGMFGIGVSMRTYPFHQSLGKQPISGYQLSDYIPSQSVKTESDDRVGVGTRNLRSLIPIAIHPRVLWQNIRIFLFNNQGIWFGAAILGALVAWLTWKRTSLPFLYLSGWTLLVLFLMYGQATYADNITGSATLGNSFLRYTLPLVPLMALGCGISLNWLRKVSRRGYFLAICAVFFFVGYGTAYAMSGDSESILATRRELARYAQIRNMAEMYSMHDAVILSERSDKIFASGSWTVVSPIPDERALTALRDSGVPVYLFHRKMFVSEDIPLSIANVFPWIGESILELDNEALYPLIGSEE